MISKAILRYVRISPRKFRQVIPLIKGKNAEEAVAIISVVKKKASLYAIELLKSAIANAKVKVPGIDTSTLYISKMVADPGPMLKRFRAASMGRASSIHKHTSHLTVELDEIKKEERAHPDAKLSAKPKTKRTPAASAPKKEITAKEKEEARKPKHKISAKQKRG